MRWFLIASVIFHLALFAVMMWFQSPGSGRQASPFAKGPLGTPGTAISPKTDLLDVELIVSESGPPESLPRALPASTGQRAVKKVTPPRAAAGKRVGFKLRPVTGYQIQISPSFVGPSAASAPAAKTTPATSPTPEASDSPTTPPPTPPGF